MNFIKQVFIKLILLTLITFSTNVLADNHDKENKEEALPLNDPFVGDSSFSGGVKVITEGASSLSEQKKIDLYTYKLVGIIKSKSNSFSNSISDENELSLKFHLKSRLVEELLMKLT